MEHSSETQELNGTIDELIENLTEIKGLLVARASIPNTSVSGAVILAITFQEVYKALHSNNSNEDSEGEDSEGEDSGVEEDN